MIHLITRRDPVLDSAKGFLILLVVFGHLTARTHPSHAFVTEALYAGIYAFHMPAFVFLAGIISKPRGILKRCVQFLTLLVVFQTAFYWYRRLMGSDAAFDWTTPKWLLWFLFSMAVWTLLTPLIAKAPRVSLVLSVALSLGAGMVDAVGYPFSLSRTLVFLPFFVLGFTHGKAVLAYVAGLRARGRVVIAGLAVVVLGALLAWDPAQKWFSGSRGYADLDVSDLSGVGHRILLHVVAAVLTMGLLVLIPREPNLLTRYGQRSLSIYLLHGFAVLVLANYVEDMAANNVWVAMGILVILTAGIAVLTSMQQVHHVMGRIGTALVPLVDRFAAPTPVAATTAPTAEPADAAARRAAVREQARPR